MHQEIGAVPALLRALEVRGCLEDLSIFRRIVLKLHKLDATHPKPNVSRRRARAASGDA